MFRYSYQVLLRDMWQRTISHQLDNVTFTTDSSLELTARIPVASKDHKNIDDGENGRYVDRPEDQHRLTRRREIDARIVSYRESENRIGI
uniref:SHSP domain-containing protein n=1 Tax=Angiostrongylus cantonensis TaxID=6313 RepID=A0A0K0DDF1_ANGCA